MVRHDPAGAGILDGQQHPVGQRAQILAVKQVGRVVERQTFRCLMVERGMRGGQLVRVPVIGDQPAAGFRGDVARVGNLAEKGKIAVHRLLEHPLAEPAGGRDVKLKQVGIEPGVIKARPDAVIALEPFAAGRGGHIAVLVLPLRHGIEREDDERGRLLAARHPAKIAADAVACGAAVIIIRAGRDIVGGRFAEIAVEAPVRIAVFHIRDPRLCAVVHAPVQPERSRQDKRIRYAVGRKAVAVHRDADTAVTQLRGAQNAVLLRKILP